MTPLDANPMIAGSWYEATANTLSQQPPLEGEIAADVAIVGAGFTGLSAALALAEAGRSVVVLEARRIGSGASGRNGGQVGSGQRVDQVTLETTCGASEARALWDIAEAAKSEVRRLITAHDIDADWRDGIAYVARSPEGASELHDYVRHLSKVYGYEAVAPIGRDEARTLIGSDDVYGGTIDRGAGHIHPLRFAQGLAIAACMAGATLFETSPVDRIEGTSLRTRNAVVRAKTVLVATNGYSGNILPEVAARILPINSFVAVTEPLREALLAEDIAVADDRFVVSYWRMVEGNRLLFGGGESYGLRFPRDIGAKVRRPLSELYPELADIGFDFVWGGTLGITPSRNPYFAELQDGVFTAGGFSGHGVALATLGGRIVAEAILGERARFDAMAALPVPTVPGGPLVRRSLVPLAMQFYAMRDRLGI